SPLRTSTRLANAVVASGMASPAGAPVALWHGEQRGSRMVSKIPWNSEEMPAGPSGSGAPASALAMGSGPKGPDCGAHDKVAGMTLLRPPSTAKAVDCNVNVS